MFNYFIIFLFDCFCKINEIEITEENYKGEDFLIFVNKVFDNPELCLNLFSDLYLKTKPRESFIVTISKIFGNSGHIYLHHLCENLFSSQIEEIDLMNYNVKDFAHFTNVKINNLQEMQKIEALVVAFVYCRIRSYSKLGYTSYRNISEFTKLSWCFNLNIKETLFFYNNLTV